MASISLLDLSSLYVCMAIKYIIVLFVETPRKFITAKLSIRKPGSSSVLIICKSLGFVGKISIFDLPTGRDRGVLWCFVVLMKQQNVPPLINCDN